MEADATTRYRSRILRELNANRENPFNSPPSSTGSHGTVSPTLTSVLSDIDGESTRKLNAEIARVTGSKKLQVNWEAAHRKWPEFYGLPKGRALSLESKENIPPRPSPARFDDDDSTQDAWLGSNRSRAQMQPSVENESDASTVLSGKSPARPHLQHASSHLAFQPRTRSPLTRPHSRTSSNPQAHGAIPASVGDMVNRMPTSATTPDMASKYASKQTSQKHASTRPSAINPAFQRALEQELPMSSPYNGSTVRSFFMPDVSHLGDFVSGTLRFNGSTRNGVPILVKHGRVVDLATQQPPNNHADIDGLEIPEDEEKIFVTMDKIRDEIVTLQEHDEMVQKYAEELQEEVDHLRTQVMKLKSRRSSDSGIGSGTGSEPDGFMYEQLLTDKKRLEERIEELQRRLDQSTRRLADNEKDNDTLSVERDRAVKKLQEACENIGDLMDKLDMREKELHTTQKQLDATLQSRNDKGSLRSDVATLKRANETALRETLTLQETVQKMREEEETLQQEMDSLRQDNNSLRREQESLMNENRSLRSNARTLMSENETLRQNAENVQNDLEAAREEIENLQQEVQVLEQEKATFREDNDSLVRHNEKYFNENKLLRRENSGFERSLHDLHDDNIRLKDEVEFLKQQLDHCRPTGRDKDLSGRFSRDDENDDNEDNDDEEHMTSAFIIPDIELQRNGANADDEATDHSGVLPPMDLATQTNEVTDSAQQDVDIRPTIEKDDSVPAEANINKGKKKKMGRDASQKVAFSLPEASTQATKAKPNVAAKRRSVAREHGNDDFAGPVPFPFPFPGDQESTGYQSTEATNTHSMGLNVKATRVSSMKTQRSSKKKTTSTRDFTSQSQSQGQSQGQSQRTMSRTGHRSAASTKNVTMENTMGSFTAGVEQETCPALSNDARRILDNLCQHSCRNCVVCSRIASHRGTVSATDLADGKKRINVSRPVPVTDRMPQVDEYVEEPTMRPSQSPGHALALVIKSLEDEAAHMSMELAKLQAKYNEADKSLGRRDRRALADEIKRTLKRLENKNDQIYALYDVLEGQKVAGQAMSEEELEMTILSITGLTARDLTDNVTWNGIPA